MKGNLLDTNVALFAMGAPERLSPAIRDALNHGSNWLSVLSYWEVAIKSMKGPLDVGDPRIWWADALDVLAADPLPLYPRHIAEIAALPALHGDPFDRALIAQAIAEELVLLTTDANIARYACDRLSVMT